MTTRHHFSHPSGAIMCREMRVSGTPASPILTGRMMNRTLKITFNKDIPIFCKKDFALFKKLTEVIYGAKIISAEDGYRDNYEVAEKIIRLEEAD